jgi:hypothetical protein
MVLGRLYERKNIKVLSGVGIDFRGDLKYRGFVNET